ncbi:MAG: hypothetical protein NTZ95_01470 [Candidatus Omnitrophica bacterium]|nr:hypothetical protein [Candidatus Omnitrophota bacterium]
MTKNIGIYIGTILLWQDLKYQEWLGKGRPVALSPEMGNRKTMRRLGRI